MADCRFQASEEVWRELENLGGITVTQQDGQKVVTVDPNILSTILNPFAFGIIQDVLHRNIEIRIRETRKRLEPDSG